MKCNNYLKLVVIEPSKRYSFFLPSKFLVSFWSASWITIHKCNDLTLFFMVCCLNWYGIWATSLWSQQSKIKLEAIVINRSVSNMAGGQLQGVIKCQENHFHISGNVDIIASRSGILNQKSYSRTSMARIC